MEIKKLPCCGSCVSFAYETSVGIGYCRTNGELMERLEVCDDHQFKILDCDDLEAFALSADGST